MTVILANGVPPTHPVPLRLFREADRLIACDGAWRKALDLGRTPDAVVGDGDSLGDGVISGPWETMIVILVRTATASPGCTLWKNTMFAG